jgi:hypothetical protein
MRHANQNANTLYNKMSRKHSNLTYLDELQAMPASVAYATDLQQLADWFNEVKSDCTLPAKDRRARELAIAIANCLVPYVEKDPRDDPRKRSRPSKAQWEQAMKLFHSSFKKFAVWPYLVLVGNDEHSYEVWTEFQVPAHQENPFVTMAARLWIHFFHEKGWQRMKRCQVCGAWIVARSKNKIVRFCSKCNRWKYWSWERRVNSPNFRRRQPRTRGI